MEQLELGLEENVVGKAVNKTLVKFYIYLVGEDGTQSIIKFVCYEKLGKLLTAVARVLGYRCGYNYTFRGEKMSSPAQKNLVFARITDESGVKFL